MNGRRRTGISERRGHNRRPDVLGDVAFALAVDETLVEIVQPGEEIRIVREPALRMRITHVYLFIPVIAVSSERGALAMDRNDTRCAGTTHDPRKSLIYNDLGSTGLTSK